MTALLLLAIVSGTADAPAASLRLILTSDLCCRSRPAADFRSPGLPRRALGGWAGLERTVDSLRARPSLFLDCGGFAFGSLEGNASRGRLGVELLNALGCDAAAIGARDFSGGLANLEVLALVAQFPLVADPMLDVSLRRRAPLFRPYVLLRCNDVRVAVIGLLDPDTRRVNPPGDVPGIAVEPVLAQCRRFLAAAAPESADVTVVIGHIGAADARLIADSVAGVDVVVAGDEEAEPMRLGGTSTAVLVAGRLGQRVGVADLRVDRAARKVERVEYVVLNVEPAEAAGPVQRLLERADSLVGPDTLACFVPVELGPDSAGLLALGSTACRLLAERHRADVVLLPWHVMGQGLDPGRNTARALAAAVPFGDRLCVVGLDDTALARLAAPAVADTFEPAMPAWGIDYFVTGDTAAWPRAVEVTRPRLRQRKLGEYRVVTTVGLYAASELGFESRGLPGDLTLDWVAEALALDTLRPAAPPRRLAAAPGARPKSVPGLVNLNSADAAALMTLPGVGPKTAQRIIDYRTQVGRFGSVEELMNVRGIGPKKYEQVRALVCVR
ncbi:MAG: helix-hairpin-helix domain-containing protein [bacterium]